MSILSFKSNDNRCPRYTLSGKESQHYWNEYHHQRCLTSEFIWLCRLEENKLATCMFQEPEIPSTTDACEVEEWLSCFTFDQKLSILLLAYNFPATDTVCFYAADDELRTYTCVWYISKLKSTPEQGQPASSQTADQTFASSCCFLHLSFQPAKWREEEDNLQGKQQRAQSSKADTSCWA